MTERTTLGMASIGAGAALGAAVFPRPFLRLFGVPAAEVTGAAALGWRLFATRTAYLSLLAARGDPAARDAFLPIQALDQLAFWHAYATGGISRRTAVAAATTSGAIVALDLHRRAQSR